MFKQITVTLARWPLLVALGLMAGAVAGVGVAQADWADYEIEQGVNYYPGPGSSQTTLLEMENNPYGFPDHEYRQRWRMDADDDFPGATEVDILNGWYKGNGVNPSGTTCFWKTAIFDEQGRNTETTWEWARDELTASYSELYSIDWDYDGFDGQSSNLVIEQVMVVPVTAESCWTGANTSPPPVHHVSTWEVD